MSKENSSLGKRLTKFIMVISAVGFGFGLWAKGLINEVALTISTNIISGCGCY